MKPKEFDALIRQKFDQNDFGYNPHNWERLEEQMDGRAKKRRIALWWLMPLMGVAASVTLAMGVNNMWRFADEGNMGVVAFSAPAYDYQNNTDNRIESSNAIISSNTIAAHNHKKAQKSVKKETEFGINLDNAISSTESIHVRKVKLDEKAEPAKKNDNVKQVAAKENYKTFKPEDEKKVKKTSIILSGGFNQGNMNNGYTVGASIRRMINDKVYVENEIAFASSNNTQSMNSKQSPAISSSAPTPIPNGAGAKVASANQRQEQLEKPADDIWINQDVTYKLSYILIAPSVGCKITHHMSLAAGPDIQSSLPGQRPQYSRDDRSTQSFAPFTDFGLVAKSEYKITKQIKAGLSYRKGINNVLFPTGQYIDRDYMQVQVHYTILNR